MNNNGVKKPQNNKLWLMSGSSDFKFDKPNEKKAHKLPSNRRFGLFFLP